MLEADSSGAARSSNLTAAAEVSDVGTGAPPSNALFFGGPLGVEERSHPLRIQAAALHQVDDCEAVGRSCLHVPDPEVKPLRVLPRVHVSAQAELILVRTAEGGGKPRAEGEKQSGWETLDQLTSLDGRRVDGTYTCTAFRRFPLSKRDSKSSVDSVSLTRVVFFTGPLLLPTREQVK